jgi:protein-S-isoprenylcysteine O-methyltransferase Ste14
MSERIAAKRIFLALRSLFFLVLFPGTVAGYIPYRIVRSTGAVLPPERALAEVPAAILCAAGAAVLLSAVWKFFADGFGTLAPLDPPKRLVVSGLYRHTRNPMYNGVLAMLIGEAWLFRSAPLLAYAAGIFVAFHLFVTLYEEPALASLFGETFHDYRRAVPRWGFTRRPYAGAGESGKNPPK